MTIQYLSESAISLPFRIGFDGNIVATTDPAKIWADRVRSVIGTIQGERFGRSFFGSGFGSTLAMYSQSNVNELQGIAEKEIANMFSSDALKGLTLDLVQITSNEGSGVVEVNISYFLPNKTLVKTTVGTVSISPQSPFSNKQIAESQITEIR